jgi:hypothetical protein
MPPPYDAAVWEKLAEYSRTLAASAPDAESRRYLNEIAARYEALARHAAQRKN